MPLGIGILISALLMNFTYSRKYERDLEAEARRLGMVYPEEIQAVEVNP